MTQEQMNYIEDVCRGTGEGDDERVGMLLKLNGFTDEDISGVVEYRDAAVEDTFADEIKPVLEQFEAEVRAAGGDERESVVAFEELFDAHTNWEEGDEPIEGQNLAFEYQDVVEGGAALITDNAAEDRQRTAPVLED